MREIKFRAWNKKAKKWEYFTLNNIHTYLEELEKHLLNGDEFYLRTGLKDKNGKEIYVGDIVRFMLPDGTWSNPQMVLFCHGSFVTKSGSLWGLGYFPDIVHNDELEGLEIIGNIHENKELLK